MNEKNKKWLIYVVIAVISYMLGAWLSTKEVEKVVEVEKIVEVEKVVEVEKIVETNSAQAKIAMNNLPLCNSSLLLSNEIVTMMSDVVANYDYYIRNPKLIEAKTVRVNEITKEITINNSLIK